MNLKNIFDIVVQNVRDVRFMGQEQKVVVRSSLVELRNRHDRAVPTLIFYASRGNCGT